MRKAKPVILSDADRATLEQWTRSRTLPARQVERAHIILLAAQGWQDKEIAGELGCHRRKAGRWRRRFLDGGLAALAREKPRPGRKPSIDAQSVVQRTTQTTPAHATDWSVRLMAHAASISPTSVRRIWRAHGLKPHRLRSFKLSRDPQFAEKLEAIVGLYLSPPQRALVLCVDEKSQIQALDRTQPGLPLRQGRARTQTHDYKRHGTTTLFAALNALEGTVIGQCAPRHRHQEYLKFLDHLAAQTPEDRDVHLIVDNYATHKHTKVKAWLRKHPRFTVHYTPTSASWLNMVERFFRDLTVRRVRAGVFRSVAELELAITEYIRAHNQSPKPFIWTAKDQDILAKVSRAQSTMNKSSN